MRWKRIIIVLLITGGILYTLIELISLCVGIVVFKKMADDDDSTPIEKLSELEQLGLEPYMRQLQTDSGLTFPSNTVPLRITERDHSIFFYSPTAVEFPPSLNVDIYTTSPDEEGELYAELIKDFENGLHTNIFLPERHSIITWKTNGFNFNMEMVRSKTGDYFSMNKGKSIN